MSASTARSRRQCAPERIKMLLVLAPPADRRVEDRLADLVVTERHHRPVAFPVTQAAIVPWQAQKLDGLTREALLIGDKSFVLHGEDGQVQRRLPVIHQAFV